MKFGCCPSCSIVYPLTYPRGRSAMGRSESKSVLSFSKLKRVRRTRTQTVLPKLSFAKPMCGHYYYPQALLPGRGARPAKPPSGQAKPTTSSARQQACQTIRFASAPTATPHTRIYLSSSAGRHAPVSKNTKKKWESTKYTLTSHLRSITHNKRY